MGLIDKIKKGMVKETRDGEDNLAKANGKIRLAVPSSWPGGIESVRSGHFGRCDCFTLVDVDEGMVQCVTVIPNPPHEQGGCLGPVNLLRGHGADAIIVHGIGMRPLVGFREAGMEVYLGKGYNVAGVVIEFLEGELVAMSDQQACGGH